MVLDSVLFKERIVNGWEASLISSKQKISAFYIMMCSSPLRFHYCIALPSLRISFTLNNSPWIHSLQKFTFPNISAINEPRTSCLAKLHYKQEYKTFLNELSLDFFFSFLKQLYSSFRFITMYIEYFLRNRLWEYSFRSLTTGKLIHLLVGYLSTWKHSSIAMLSKDTHDDGS